MKRVEPSPSRTDACMHSSRVIPISSKLRTMYRAYNLWKGCLYNCVIGSVKLGCSHQDVLEVPQRMGYHSSHLKAGIMMQVSSDRERYHLFVVKSCLCSLDNRSCEHYPGHRYHHRPLLGLLHCLSEGACDERMYGETRGYEGWALMITVARSPYRASMRNMARSSSLPLLPANYHTLCGTPDSCNNRGRNLPIPFKLPTLYLNSRQHQLLSPWSAQH
jgi:hypothetical protein